MEYENIVFLTDFENPELDLFARLNERELAHYYEPEGGLFIAESAKVVLRALNAGYEPVALLVESRQISKEAGPVLERCPGVPVYAAELPVLMKLTGYSLTGGVLCAMRRRKPVSPESLLTRARAVAVLEDVTNPTNVGAIFRSAAAMFIDTVLLTPGCSDPLYRRAARVSMGTVFQIPWAFFPSSDYLPVLKKAGFTTAALALSDNSVSIDHPCLSDMPKTALLLGSEGYGLSEETIRASDYVVKIPMSHGVDSLNVAAASAVAFWELVGRHHDICS